MKPWFPNIHVTWTGCWIGFSRYWNGYSKAHVNRRTVLAHRLFYERLIGPIPEGHDLDHLCRNRACFNPAHLEPVSRRENLRRGTPSRRAAKLLPENVEAIRGLLAAGHRVKELAPLFGLSVSAVYMLKRGDTWKGV
jgi:hypothetical protein